MSRVALVTALVTGSAIATAGYFALRRPRPRALPSGLLPIVTPIIDLRTAEDALATLDTFSTADEVTVLLHTYGGSMLASVLIASALRDFPRSRAIVPYLASSGGTLIALNAAHLHMGRGASLSAVDPVLEDGLRARDVPDDEPRAAVKSIARHYGRAVRTFLRESLAARLYPRTGAPIDRAVALFMGDEAPHEWPIRRDQIDALGIPVEPVARDWADLVDATRRSW